MTKDRFPEFITEINHLFPNGDKWNYRYKLRMKAGHPHLRLLRRKCPHMIIAGLLPDYISARLVYWIVVAETPVRPALREDEILYNDYFKTQDGIDWDANFVFCLVLAAHRLNTTSPNGNIRLELAKGTS